MTPAQAIDAELARQGIATARSRAAIVGEYDTHWGRYVRGGRRPQTSKVEHWLRRCERQGYAIVLRWDHERASVVRE